MDINQLIITIKKKIEDSVVIENIKIEDKTYLHQGHPHNQIDKFHLKLTIKSLELKKKNKIEANKKIYGVLHEELKKYIHSIQILII